MNLNYIIIYVNDLPKMRTFYTEALGMTNIGAVSADAFATMRPAGGGAMVGLQSKASSVLPPKYETQPGSVELSFAVDDVDATWQQWKDKGVEMISEPTDLPFGRYFLAKDPEGHYLSAYKFAQPGS